MDDVEMSPPPSWAPEGSRVVAVSSLLEALLRGSVRFILHLSEALSVTPVPSLTRQLSLTSHALSLGPHRGRRQGKKVAFGDIRAYADSGDGVERGRGRCW